jgi:tetratricopeptide (TPR) repeat protein
MKNKLIFISIAVLVLLGAGSYIAYDLGLFKKDKTPEEKAIDDLSPGVNIEGEGDFTVEPIYALPEGVSIPDLEKQVSVTEDLAEDVLNIAFSKIDQLRADLKTDPGLFDSWINLGIYLKLIGDFDYTRDVWEFAAKIRPESSVPFHNLGDLYHHEFKDFNKSEENYLKAIENDSLNVFTYQNLYELYRYSYKEKADLADNILLQGMDANPNDPYLVILLGRYYEETGDTSQAIIYYERALEIDPSNEELKKDLEKLKN